MSQLPKPAASSPIRVGIFYPSDPLGDIPGGIEAFIRGIIGYAPEDLAFSVIGLTTDAHARPVRQWREHRLRDRVFRHYPVYAVDDPKRQPRIPATIRYMARLWPSASRLGREFDVHEFHRLEPALMFTRSAVPATAVFHQNMDVIRGEGSDIRWKHLPGLYFAVERFGLKHLSCVFVVQEQGKRVYQARYPGLADRFRFTPTWMDPEIFHPVAPAQALALRGEELARFGIGKDDAVVSTVGRLDAQKDPLMLLEAFKRMLAEVPESHLVLIGDGVLREPIRERAQAMGLADRVHLTGLMPPQQVARVLNACDLFALASQYEGMPIAVLEALGCGLPVVSTDVGEVRRVVSNGENGQVIDERSPQRLGQALIHAWQRRDVLRGEPCVSSALRFTPQVVLAALYDNYRSLAARRRRA